MNDKPKRGGKREGAGAPKKAETVVRSYRCMPDEIPYIKSVIKKAITELRLNTTSNETPKKRV
jgi:hypothetical protein